MIKRLHEFRTIDHLRSDYSGEHAVTIYYRAAYPDEVEESIELGFPIASRSHKGRNGHDISIDRVERLIKYLPFHGIWKGFILLVENLLYPSALLSEGQDVGIFFIPSLVFLYNPFVLSFYHVADISVMNGGDSQVIADCILVDPGD